MRSVVAELLAGAPERRAAHNRAFLYRRIDRLLTDAYHLDCWAHRADEEMPGEVSPELSAMARRIAHEKREWALHLIEHIKGDTYGD